MMELEVKILLNRQEEDGRLAIFSRFGSGDVYREGDELEHVATLTVEGESMSEILNRSFAMTNHGSGVTASGYTERSLSAGDVIEIADDLRYSVEGIGFKLVEGWAL